MLDKHFVMRYILKNQTANAKKRNSTCGSDFRERMFGANPYEENMEGVSEQRSEIVVASDGKFHR